MNALELLKEDHEKVSALFEQAEAAKGHQQKKQVYEKIASELETHTYIEETIFYPAIRESDDLKDLVLESIEEHKQVKTLIREINNLTGDNDKFDAKLTVLQENVEHHVEEEENDMFPQVEQYMDESRLEELGRELEAAKINFGKQRRSASSARK
ncbi:MAG TPA: hemerythrin domain-containing protein [Blastocatellia bacterium]|nr:hemerythrin domain-containing protein [Blastocatellia bacterium]HMV86660.1 hemerythrin domain-containing protein [Blastocatellia bacterium]HMX24128.1 hemerythrin domain-containing protein [Blastocatellia bacterium]HMY70522.1 hemerythrin domain-containing protein [Blastocatellia bacterium]HMZ21272.1 hemerythrin domain-containing protein [Blastocatellia bacterium]